MYLKHLTIKDFGPLESLDVEFIAGANGIKGPNGRGKSHIIAAIKFLLSGQLAKNNGWYVRGYGHLARKAIVEGVFVNAGGDELYIKRTLGVTTPGDPAKSEPPKVTAKAALTHGDRKLRSVTDVNQYLQELTGLANVQQLESVFVGQGLATKPVIGLRRAERLKAMQYRAGVERCQRALEYANTMLGMISVEDSTSELAAYKEQLAQTEGRIERLAAELAAVPAVDQDKVQEARELVTKANKRGELQEELKQALAKQDALNQEQVNIVGSLQAAERGMEEEQRKLDAIGGEAAYNGAMAIIATADANAKLLQQQRQCEQLLHDLREEYSKHQQPTPPTEPQEKLLQLGEEMLAISNELNAAKKFVQVFGDTGKCPTCGQPADDRLLQENRQKISQLQPRYDEVVRQECQLRAAWDTYNQAIAAYESWLDSFTKRVEAAKQQRESIGQVQVISENELELARTTVKEYKAYKSSLERYTSIYHDMVKEKATCDSSLEALDGRISELKQSIAQLPAEDALNECRQLILQADEIKERTIRLSGQLSELRSSADALRGRIEKLTTANEQIERRKRAIDLLNGVKRVFHHTAIPQARVARYMRSINARMARYCEWLHMPFTTFVDEESCSFMVQFHDHAEPAFQLSGGQAMMAAWAYHLAEYEQHGGELGMLCMDEPTTNLSDDNIDNVVGIIRRLNDYCGNAGLQFIMVTHEPMVASAFANVVSL